MRKVWFILLAVILTLIELSIKVIVDEIMGWKSGGGAVPLVCFIALVFTWKICLKWGNKPKNISEPIFNNNFNKDRTKF
ncbi:MAG: hypothetical protein IPJ32_04635 [Sphingobacteriaceae bacterium]|nr:hypothetical protein [Sphingobacteriaceae bacterium]